MRNCEVSRRGEGHILPDRTQLLAWAPHDVELAGGCAKYVHMAAARRLRGGHGRKDPEGDEIVAD
jgi:hypothetical protein